MSDRAFYNDNDPYVCAWLQNLRGAGNAIVPRVAAAFIAAFMETEKADG